MWDISDGLAQMSDERLIPHILIEYIKPIGQMSDEPFKFFGYTEWSKQSHAQPMIRCILQT